MLANDMFDKANEITETLKKINDGLMRTRESLSPMDKSEIARDLDNVSEDLQKTVLFIEAFDAWSKDKTIKNALALIHEASAMDSEPETVIALIESIMNETKAVLIDLDGLTKLSNSILERE